jgi:hypothetical protein
MKKTTTPGKKTAASEAKIEAKKTSAKPVKGTAPKTAKKESGVAIDKVCELALKKLRELNIDQGLQSEIEWCLGSYQNDKNPSGLYLMAKRALAVFSVELASKSKGVTAKLVADLEKAIGNN